VKREVEEVIGLDCSGAVLASAKQGIGIDEILAAIVARIPAPADNRDKDLRALIFDSYYDPYKARPRQLDPRGRTGFCRAHPAMWGVPRRSAGPCTRPAIPASRSHPALGSARSQQS
jgi:hypothetical protein